MDIGKLLRWLETRLRHMQQWLHFESTRAHALMDDLLDVIRGLRPLKHRSIPSSRLITIPSALSKERLLFIRHLVILCCATSNSTTAFTFFCPVLDRTEAPSRLASGHIPSHQFDTTWNSAAGFLSFRLVPGASTLQQLYKEDRSMHHRDGLLW